VPPELSVIVNVAVRVPEAAGENATLITQLPFGAIERFALQVVPAAAENSLASAPATESGLAARTRFAWPVFDNITCCGALDVPIV
jgi:hypothetical protein